MSHQGYPPRLNCTNSMTPAGGSCNGNCPNCPPIPAPSYNTGGGPPNNGYCTCNSLRMTAANMLASTINKTSQVSIVCATCTWNKKYRQTQSGAYGQQASAYGAAVATGSQGNNPGNYGLPIVPYGGGPQQGNVYPPACYMPYNSTPSHAPPQIHVQYPPFSPQTHQDSMSLHGQQTSSASWNPYAVNADGNQHNQYYLPPQHAYAAYDPTDRRHTATDTANSFQSAYTSQAQTHSFNAPSDYAPGYKPFSTPFPGEPQ